MRLFITSEVVFSLVRLFFKNSLKKFLGIGDDAHVAPCSQIMGAVFARTYAVCEENPSETKRKVLEVRYPKDPAVLKILRRSKCTMRSKFTTHSKCTMATPPALTQFSWVLQAFFPPKRGSQRSKSGGLSTQRIFKGCFLEITSQG